jgi:hypothetical protein
VTAIAVGLPDQRSTVPVMAELSVYKPDGVEIWLHARNPSLDGARPIDLLAVGEFERVVLAVERLITGAVNAVIIHESCRIP